MVWNRVFLGMMIGLNIFLAYRVLWSDQGLIAYLDLKTRHADMERRIKELDKKSLDLSQEIRLLKSDRTYIEKMIRQQMNFVKQDEIMYIFPEDSTKEQAGSTSDAEKN